MKSIYRPPGNRSNWRCHETDFAGSGPGGVDVLETAWNDNLAEAALLQPARNRFVFGRLHFQIGRAGTLTRAVRPTPRGLRLIRDHRYRVTLRLWVTYTPIDGRSRTTGLYGLHPA